MLMQFTAFGFAALLGLVSTALGFALYRYGSAHIRYQGARFGGAVAIAGGAFYLMSSFYFHQLEGASRLSFDARINLADAVTAYDSCLAREGRLEACRYQIKALHDACDSLTH